MESLRRKLHSLTTHTTHIQSVADEARNAATDGQKFLKSELVGVRSDLNVTCKNFDDIRKTHEDTRSLMGETATRVNTINDLHTSLKNDLAVSNTSELNQKFSELSTNTTRTCTQLRTDLNTLKQAVSDTTSLVNSQLPTCITQSSLDSHLNVTTQKLGSL